MLRNSLLRACLLVIIRARDKVGVSRDYENIWPRVPSVVTNTRVWATDNYMSLILSRLFASRSKSIISLGAKIRSCEIGARPSNRANETLPLK